MTETPRNFPLSLAVDYPDQPLSRLTTFFRLIVVMPIIIIYSALSGPGTDFSSPVPPEVLVSGEFQGFPAGYDYRDWSQDYRGGPFLLLPTILMLLFRRKYPRWWFDWNVAVTKFCIRITAYVALLRDEYPAVEEEQAVHVEIAYPVAASELNRWLPLVKWLLALPHYIVLSILSVAAGVCVLFSWFAILFTCSHPRVCFDFIVGVMRWWLRVSGYAFLLVTDQYPRFSLEDWPPAKSTAEAGRTPAARSPASAGQGWVSIQDQAVAQELSTPVRQPVVLRTRQLRHSIPVATAEPGEDVIEAQFDARVV